jgi:SpoVK/Ycf46/Vps4 family AAA+-type ATPase
LDTPLIRSLRAAVEAVPGDVTLRLHLAEQLLVAGDAEGAAEQAATALQHEPESQAARDVLGRALGRPAQPAVDGPEPAQQATPETAETREPEPVFDWAAAEQELGYLEVEEGRVRLQDVGGLKAVKERLEAAFLAPMRNPELRRLYGKNMRGGLMLYGPPGCGKTFVARAVAGELGAKFVSVTLSDVLDMYIGQSERNLHEVFETARRNAPCVVFLDEIDALGQKRSQLRSSAMRGTVNQLLVELDDVRDSNEGVFVLAATNHPWDVDTALKRPGRFDRTLLVLPPDAEARAAILRYHLRDRHADGIDIVKLAKRTDGYSGADLAHACDVAAERALLDSVRSGRTRMIGMADLDEALKEIKPSTGPWFAAARNVAMFANEGGVYDDLLAYLKKHRLA